MATKSNFTFTIAEKNGHKFILIYDEDRGGMSVTNDIENVIKHIGLEGKIDPKEYGILYRDSMGMWDGYGIFTKEFYHVGGSNENEAMERYLKNN